jgi:hypothetical protein
MALKAAHALKSEKGDGDRARHDASVSRTRCRTQAIQRPRGRRPGAAARRVPIAGKVATDVPMQSELVMGVVVDSFDLAQFSAGAAALAYVARQ